MKVRSPFRMALEIFRHMFRHQNVTRVAAIHHALRHVDSSARNVRAIAHVGDLIHGTAVDSHPNGKFGMAAQRAVQFLSRIALATSGLSRKTSAMPSPVGRRKSLPSRFAR